MAEAKDLQLGLDQSELEKRARSLNFVMRDILKKLYDIQ